MSPQKLITRFFTIVLPLLWVLGRVPVFHKAYMDHLRILDDDGWLRVQCADPVFVSRMIRHHDVCQRVRETFQQPALLVALQACIPHEWGACLLCWLGLPSSLGWESVAIIALVLLLAPGFLLPLYRAHREHTDHRRMLEACSPDLPIPWCYAKPPPSRRRQTPMLLPAAGDYL